MVQTEDDPLNLMVGTAAHGLAVLSRVEDVVVAAGGAVMRYGALYGPGAIDDQVALVRKRQYPLVGRGAGYSSWVHLDDAASATVLAVEQQVTGVFNIVDDDPPPPASGCPTSPTVPARRRRGASRFGWGSWPVTMRSR